MDKKKPFLLEFCAPPYLASASVAIKKMMALIFILSNIGILGTYLTESPVFPTLNIRMKFYICKDVQREEVINFVAQKTLKLSNNL